MQKLQVLKFVLVTWLCFGAILTATAADELRIVYHRGMSPLQFEDAKSRAAGILLDLWRLWAQKTGKGIRFVKADSFDESLRLLTEGKADLHAGLLKTQQHGLNLMYSEPLLAQNYYLFTHPSVHPVRSLDKASGLIVGILKGGVAEQFVRSQVAADRIASYERFQDLCRAALGGEIRVFVASQMGLLHYLKENLLTNIFEYDQTRPLFSQTFYTATRKGNTGIIPQVNGGMKAVSSAEIKQLRDQWIVRDFEEIPSQPLSAHPLGLTAEEQRWLEAHPVIRVHNEKDWPPFNFFEYGSPRGLSIDYMNLLGARLGLKIEYVTGPSWSEFLSMAKRKELDVMLNIVRTEDRHKYLLFTEPYVRNPNVIVSLQEQPYETIDELFGKTVAFPKGFFYEEVLTRLFPQIKRLPVEDTLASLKAVTFGKADVALGEEAVARTLINKNMLSGLRISGEVNIGNPDLTNLRIGVRNDWPLLRSAIAKAMAVLKPVEMNQIRHKWLMVDKSQIVQKEVSPTESAAGKETIALSAAETDWLAAHKKIRFTGDPDWLPQEAFTSEGRYVGIVADILDLLESRLGILFERVPVKTWNEAVRLAEAAEVDILSETTSSERDTMTFTDPYLVFPVVIIAEQGAAPISDPSDLKGKRVAVVKDYGYVIPFRRQFPDLEYAMVQTVRDGLIRLSAGEVDAFVSAAPTAYYLMSELGLTNLRVIGSTGLSIDLGFGVRKDAPLLVSILNKALASITEEEKFKIRQKWVPVIDTTGPETAVPISYGRLVLYTVAVFLVLCLFAWLFIKLVKKERVALSFGSSWFRGLVLTGLSLFVIIVFLVGWFSLERNRKKLLDDVGENLKGVLNIAEDRLDLWLAEKTSFMEQLGRDPELTAITKSLLSLNPAKSALLSSVALEDARLFFKEHEDIFSNIGFFIINPDQINIGSMWDEELGTRSMIFRHHPEVVKRAFQGKVGFVPHIVSDFYEKDRSGRDQTTKPFAMFFVGPVQDADGQILAAMVVRIDPGIDFSRALQSFGVGGTGETYAFDAHGRLLSASRYDNQLRQIGLLTEGQASTLNVEIRDPGGNMLEGHIPETERPKQPFTRMTSRAIQLKRDMERSGKRNGHSRIEVDKEGYRDYRGVPVFGAWLWNADLQMGLATEVDVEEALASHIGIRQMVLWVLGITLFLSIGATLLVLILGERTSKALTLAKDDLEKKVAERTAELQDKQDQVEAAEERSRLLLTSAGEGIFGVDLDGRVTFINPAASRMLGYRSDELLGQDVHAKVHHSHTDGSRYPKEVCPMYLSRADGTDHHVANEVLWRKDGTSIPVEYTSVPMKKNEKVVGTVITFRDITERKRAEEALQKSEKEYRALFENASVGIMVAQDQMFRFVNPQMEKLLAFDQTEIKSRSISDFFHPDDRKIVQERHEKRLQGESAPEVYHARIIDRHEDIKWIELKVVPIQWDDRPAVLGFMTDITERKRAEEELRRNVEELERFNKLAIGREKKMIQLKQEINELLFQSKQDKRYKIVE
jgi:PAS domain S-box-containing protein